MQNETTLHGLLVGLGVEHKDGSKDFRWLDKPIHNRIVACGLDAYFQYNGSNSATTTSGSFDNRFLSSDKSGSSTVSGLLQWFAIGTDGTATRFDDTALRAQVGGYSSASTWYQTPYTGWRVNSDDTISTRMQNNSIAVDSPTTIREMGWFEKYYNVSPTTMVMFSRVVLDTPVHLEAGEKLLACYQLELTYNNLQETEVPSSFLTGLLDSDGNQLRGFQSLRIYQETSNNPVTRNTWYSGGTRIGAEVVSSSSLPITGSYMGTINGFQHIAPFKAPYGSHNWNGCIIYSRSTSGWSLPEQFARNTTYSSQQLNDSVNGENFEYAYPLDYVPGTYYRDRRIVVSPSWPAGNSSYKDVYAIGFNGLCMRFGHFDENNQWVAKPWRKEFGKRYEFIYRTKLSTADTP